MSSPHHPEYIRLAYERGMLVALARHVEAEYLPTDVSETPKSVISCDNLAREVGEVPRESWAAMVSKLERMAQSRLVEMSKYVQVPINTTPNSEEETEIVPRPQAVASSKPSPKGPAGPAHKPRHDPSKARVQLGQAPAKP